MCNEHGRRQLVFFPNGCCTDCQRVCPAEPALGRPSSFHISGSGGDPRQGMAILLGVSRPSVDVLDASERVAKRHSSLLRLWSGSSGARIRVSHQWHSYGRSQWHSNLAELLALPSRTRANEDLHVVDEPCVAALCSATNVALFAPNAARRHGGDRVLKFCQRNAS